MAKSLLRELLMEWTANVGILLFKRAQCIHWVSAWCSTLVLKVLGWPVACWKQEGEAGREEGYLC